MWGKAAELRNFPNTQPLGLSEKCCRYKWEAYCGTNRRRTAAFPFSTRLRSQQGAALQMRGVRRYKSEVYCQSALFGQVVWVELSKIRPCSCARNLCLADFPISLIFFFGGRGKGGGARADGGRTGGWLGGVGFFFYGK